jgi:hypothetical protein
MTRQVTDNLYIELDYFTPEEYYTYEAVAAAALTAESTAVCDASVIIGGAVVEANGSLIVEGGITAQVSKIVDSQTTLTSSFSQTSTISHIEGADLFAFSEAELAALVARLRDYNSSITGVFSTALDGTRARFAESSVAATSELSADAEKVIDIEAAVTAAFSISSAAEVIKTAAANLSTAAQLASQGTKVISYASQLTATSELSLPRLDKNSRTPVSFVLANSGTLTTVRKQFGSGSISSTSSSTGTGRVNNTHTINLSNRNFTIDFWAYNPASQIGGDIFFQANGTNNSGGLISTALGLRKLSNGQLRLTVTAPDLTSSQNDSVGLSIPSNTWVHFRIAGKISDTNTTYSVWFNGVRCINAVTFRFANTSQRFINFYSNSSQNFDEILIKDGLITDPSVTSFTVPSQAWANDLSTLALFHFDGNLDDDAVFNTDLFAADLSCEFTQVVEAGKVISADADLSSASAMTADITRVRDAQVELTSQGFVVAVIGRKLDDVADLSSAFTVSVQADLVAEAAGNLDTVSELTATVGLLQTNQIEISSEFDISTTGEVVKVAQAEIISQFDQSADLQRIRTSQGNLVAENFVIAVAGQLLSDIANLVSVCQFTVQANVVQENIVAAASEFSTTAVIGLVKDFDCQFNVDTSATIDSERIRPQQLTLACDFAQQTNIELIAGYTADLTADTAVTVSLERIITASTALNSSADLQAVAARVVDFRLAAASQFTHSIVANYTADNEIIGDAVATNITVVAKTGLGAADLNCIATLTAAASAVNEYAVQMPVQANVQAVPLRIFDFDIGSSQQRGVAFRSNYGAFLQSNTSSGTYGAFVVSFWSSDPLGSLLDGDPSAFEPSNYSNKSVIKFTPEGNLEYSVAYNGFVQWNLNDIDLDEYHHYLLRVNLAETTNALKYQLFVDGQARPAGLVYATATTAPEPPNYQITTSATNFAIQLTALNLGANTWFLGTSQGYGHQGFSGSVSQFYFDFTNSYTASTYPVQNTDYLRQFYNLGFVEFGQQGTDSGLARPRHYLELLDFTNSRSISDQGTGNNSWQWKEVRDNPQIVGSDIVDYTASTQDNSQEEIPGPVIAVFKQITEAQSVQVISTTMNSGSTAAITANKTVSTDAAVSAVTELTAAVRVIKEFELTSTAELTLISTAEKTAPVQANLVTETQLSVDIDLVAGSLVNASSVFEFIAITGVLGSATADFNTESTMSVSALKIKDVFISTDSALSVLAQVNYTASAEFNQASTAELTAAVTRTIFADIDLEFAGNFDCRADKIATVTAQLNTDTEFSADNKLILGGSAVLQALYSQLTLGDVIQLDPYRTYQIPRESRVYKINKETRLYAVDSESRIYKIGGYPQ